MLVDDPPIVSLSFTNSFGKQLAVHPSIVIRSDGIVVGWKFYARFAGVIMAGVWEQNSENSNIFTLVGKTRLEVSTEGAYVWICIIMVAYILISTGIVNTCEQ